MTDEQIKRATELGSVIRHPIRLRLIAHAGDVGMCGPNRFAIATRDRVNVINYHLNELVVFGAMEVAAERPVRAVREKEYRLTPIGEAILALVETL